MSALDIIPYILCAILLILLLKKQTMQKHESANNFLYTQIKERFANVENNLEKQQFEIKQSIKQVINETNKLNMALSNPQKTGKWGELQLKRVVELAGMEEHVDYNVQEFFQNHGQIGNKTDAQPDMTIKLPGNRQIFVDAKTSINFDEKDEEKFSKNIRNHIVRLANKSYWEFVENSPELVIMFIPTDGLFSMALIQDPGILEYAAEKNIILASPITLIAVLKAIASAWRNEAVNKNAKEILNISKLLLELLDGMSQKINIIGTVIENSKKSYYELKKYYENEVKIKKDELTKKLNIID